MRGHTAVAPDRFGFTPFSNSPIEDQLPCNDKLTLMSRLHCDCWSTLASPNPSRKELRRWQNIFREMLCQVDRFGLIIHFGDPSDNFVVAEIRSVLAPDCLFGLSRDKLYEITMN
jgi:hypothetical protein